MQQSKTAKKIVLPGGLTILHERNPISKAFCIGIWTRTGARDEKSNEAGLCHFLEHMLFKGTETRTAKQISQEIEKVGGSLDAFTTKETMCIYAQVLQSRREIAFELIADMLNHSRFEDEHVTLERKVVLEEIGDIDDAPDDLIHELFAAVLFPRHPLGRPILGSRSTVARFKRADLVRYSRRIFRASNLVVAVYGNIDEAELVDYCSRRFQFPGGKLPRDTTRLVKLSAKRKHVRRKLHQQHVIVGQRIFSFLDERRYSLMVLNALMGGGMSSRLFQKIREELGLAYNVFSYVDHSRDTGVFAACLAVNPANVGKALGALEGEFRAATRGAITRGELRDTKEHIKGRILLGLETSTSRMMRLARNEISFGRQVSERELLREIEGVTMADVVEVAREVFDVDAFTTVSLGPSPAGMSN